ncbi:oxalate decarboxylase family bicupin [Xanthovirga aplysinae]|uniref:oxalate decarboxylase family bicupin n=1 Tax=Xanthovirga aplysinae TaxID=2529853 RepID=UPI0012BB9968|nr:oxalate decarboxylase family bicupin [Xanthovirga aplysinae]MTI33142.1 cupin domain-containing protein [Xanthovirga aplysinae]
MPIPNPDYPFKKVPIPEPIRKDGAGASDLGPRDIARDLENPDMLIPPVTDAGNVPNLKFSFSDTHMNLYHGGWSREVTQRELPIATTLAGVNMRLKPGGVRELHWHKEAEWAYMLQGKARISAVDQEGHNFVDDVEEGELWYFPPGIPHSIQGMEEGCEFLLVFDDGSFSESHTFNISDWLAHTPKDVLATNFGLEIKDFEQLAEKRKFIFQSEVPPGIESQTIKGPKGFPPEGFSFNLMAQKAIKTSGGCARIVDSTNFPISKTIAAALVEIEPGGIREMHWHPNNDEWQYFIKGKGRMTVFASAETARTFNYNPGDVGYVPFAFGHYIQNTGDEKLVFLEMFKSNRFADISLNQWMALSPKEVVKDNIDASPALMAALRKEKWPIVK